MSNNRHEQKNFKIPKTLKVKEDLSTLTVPYDQKFFRLINFGSKMDRFLLFCPPASYVKYRAMYLANQLLKT